MKVVLDTNVIVSGFLNPYGAPGSLVGLAAAGELLLCYDARILAEYREVLLRPKFDFDADAIDDFLIQIQAEGEATSASPLPHHLPDRSDEPFLEVALSSHAESLVTGNRGHFPKRLCQGIKVLAPAELMGLLARPR